jgi:aryl-alcohol dehydrogenase-like predicted oxidoreductase
VAGRDLERELVPMLDSEGIGLLVYSPLAGGFLSGKQARDMQPPQGSRRSTHQFPPVDEDRAYRALDVMRPIAEAHRASLAQVSLAWLLQQRVVSTVLVGAKRMDQLEDNLHAANVTLGAAELAAIDDASRLPAEYPGWMFDFQLTARRDLLASSHR